MLFGLSGEVNCPAEFEAIAQVGFLDATRRRAQVTYDGLSKLGADWIRREDIRHGWETRGLEFCKRAVRAASEVGRLLIRKRSTSSPRDAAPFAVMNGEHCFGTILRADRANHLHSYPTRLHTF